FKQETLPNLAKDCTCLLHRACRLSISCYNQLTMKRLTNAQILKRARSREGLLHTRVIDSATVVTAEWVRYKCQFGCGGYGQRLTCPPYSPTPAQTRKILDGYSRALLLHSAGAGADVSQIAVELEREIFLAGRWKALAMGCGPCRHCQTCVVTPSQGKGRRGRKAPPADPQTPPCLHPELARPSLEACGIDVFSTARRHRLPIQVVTDYDKPTNFYALVLID
ncbi:MAG: DUF2284 domain-containing protein, partial [Phycisphaerae bacterium]|nr:DUF2284 domain-containing protein [Phycisphaerae bacterium]